VLGRLAAPTLLLHARQLHKKYSRSPLVSYVEGADCHRYLVFAAAREPGTQGDWGRLASWFSRAAPLPRYTAKYRPTPYASSIVTNAQHPHWLHSDRYRAAWWVAKPIQSLRIAFDGVAGGDLGLRVMSLISVRQDELADLGRDFDLMAERLQAGMEGQRRLLHDVSHEVRSPLARLQVAVGLL
jgi:two-component system, OmpR family, sensor kinase